MSQISAVAVKALRDKTNAPMMDCKAALTEASGDMEKAIELIRKRNKDIQVKKGERETAEGRIATFIDTDDRIGAIVEMRCESAPVVKSEHFIALANDIAKQVAIENPASVETMLKEPFVGNPKHTVNDRIGEVVGIIREHMRPARFTRLTGLLGQYVHHDGSVGVLLQVDGASADPQLLRDVCMHITAKNPVAARRDDVSADTIAKEKEIALSQMQTDPKNKNKPANIMQMIVEGKMKSWFADNVLEEQPFVKDDTKTVGQLLQSAGLKLVRFVRYRVGELS
jgi:elongation factor Ts